MSGKIKQSTIYIAVSIMAVIIIVVALILTNIQNNQQSNTATTEQQPAGNNDSGDASNTITYQTIDNDSNVEQSEISDLDGIVQNVPDSEISSINRMFGYTLDLNGINNKINDAVVRDGTYSQSLIDTDRLIYQTTFMIDIPSLQQSYYVKDLYSPLPVEQSGLYDYTVQITCPTNSQLIYQPFDCVDRISYEQTGVKK